MKDVISLSECPQKLQEAVVEYTNRWPEVRILEAQKFSSTPFKDKSIIDTTFRVFTIHGNYFHVFSQHQYSESQYGLLEDVSESSMIAGEIADIVRLSPEWFERV